MPVFIPPRKASYAAKLAYTVRYLRAMAANNDKMAAHYREQDDAHDAARHFEIRSKTFREVADCIAQLLPGGDPDATPDTN
jgi:hypothetical protein